MSEPATEAVKGRLATKTGVRCPNCGTEHPTNSGNQYCPKCSRFFAGIGGFSHIDTDGNLSREKAR